MAGTVAFIGPGKTGSTVWVSSDDPMPVVNVAGSGGNVYSGSIGATLTAVKTTPGTLESWALGNNNSVPSYVQIFDATVANVILGSTAPKISIELPANSGSNLQLPGIPFANAITVAVTTTRAGLTGPVTTCDLNIFFT